jgi:hypothetical protein
MDEEQINMSRFWPAISYLAVILALLAMAFIGEVPLAAAFLGALVGSAIDPFVIVGAVAIGLTFRSQFAIVCASLALTITLSVLVFWLNRRLASSLPELFFLARFTAVLGFAYVANIFNPRAGPIAATAIPRFAWVRSWLGKVFPSEKAWRIFVVLQIVAIVVLVYVDITNMRRWDLLPEFLTHSRRWEFRWDFLESRFWSRYPYNWLAVTTIFGPALSTAAYSWISAADTRPRKERVTAKK